MNPVNFSFQKEGKICSNFSALQGLWGGIVGPTLLDLQERTATNKEQIAQALVAKNVGSIVGNVASAFVYDMFTKRTGMKQLKTALQHTIQTMKLP